MALRDGPLLALVGALGFLSRLPVGRSERAWEAFRTAPWTLPVAGALLGALLAIAVGIAVGFADPTATVALVYLVAIVALTGINHFDGVADLGDAIVVHGDAERRRAVMGDTTLGVGGTLALGLVLAGLALAGLGLAELSVGTAVGLVVAAEVGAKLAMATLVALGSPAHEGFGAAVAGETEPRGLAVPLALALPVAVLTWPSTAAVVALVGSLAAATALLWWSRQRLGGVTGDVIGAANELARVVALHAGLVAATSGVDLSRALLATRLPEVVRWTLW